MLVPVSISREGLILKVKGNKTLTSNTFIAYFGQGREKLLNQKEWVLTSLLKTGEFAEYGVGTPIVTHLYKENCALYWRDWSSMPTLGVWGKDYPSLIIPKEVVLYA